MSYLIVKYQDQVVPKDYLTRVLAKLEKAKTAFSFAVTDKNETGGRRITVLAEDMNSSIEELMDIQQTYKQYPAIFLFEEKPAGLLEEDRQPFVMVTDHDDQPVAVAFVVGQYDNVAKKGSAHNPQAIVAKDKLKTKLEAVYDAVDNKIDDFADELRSKLLTRELENLGTEVCISVMAASEPPHIQGFVKAMGNAKEFEFGFVSDHLGFGVEAQVEKPAEPAKKMSLQERLGLVKKSPVSEPAAPAAEPANQPPAQPPPDAGVRDDDYEMVQCPTGLSNKQAKDWYKREVGFKPDVKAGYNLCKVRPMVPKKKVKALAEIKKVAESGPSEAVLAARAHKDTTPHHIPATLKAAEKEAVRETKDAPVPVRDPNGIPENEKVAITKGFLKLPTVVALFDEVGETIMPPSIAKEMEVNRPSVNQQIGLDGGFERWHNIPEQQLMAFAAMSKRAIVQLLGEYRFNFLKLHEAHKNLMQQKGTASPTPQSEPGKITAPATPAAAPAAPSPDAASSKTSTSFGMPARRKRA